MAKGARTRRSPNWTISLVDDLAADQQLTETFQRAPARLVPNGHQAGVDIRLISQPEPAAASDGRVPHVIVADAIDETVLRTAIQSGAAAVISPDVTVEAVRVLFRAVAIGYFPIPRHLAAALATRLEPSTPASLTGRDRIILEHLARGDTIRTIAQRLACSERHTRRHLRTLWDKMEVPGRAEGLVVAARQGLLSL